jgi:5-deoxy-glucuronate isomerase
VTQYLYRPNELASGVKPLDFMAAKRIELDPSSPSCIVETGNDEVAFVIISGETNFVCGQNKGTAHFKDMIYVPWHSRIELKTEHKTIAMQVNSPSDRDTQFAHIAYSDVAKDPARHKVFGLNETASLRDVYMFLDDKFPAARLLMGICEGSTGSWTSWPPHEHAQDREELYVYFDMGKSFSIQAIYENLDQPLFCGFVRDGDLVAVPKGFHPNVSAPAGRLTYFYAMAARTAGKREFMTLNIQEGLGELK